MSSASAAALVTLAYPFAVFWIIRRDPTVAIWVTAALGAALLIVRLFARPAAPGPSLALPIALLGLALLGRAVDAPRLTLAWPVVVNLTFLWTFATSLRSDPIICRFARLQDPALTPDKVAYCRTVTKVWCGFFALNALTIALLALAGDLAWWTLYTGVVNYLLMGALLAGEVVVRGMKFGWEVSLPHRIALRLLGAWRRAFAR